MAENENVDPNKVSDVADAIKDASPELKAFIEYMAQASKGVKGFGDGLDRLAGQIKSAKDTGEGFGESLSGLVGTNSGFNKSIRNAVYNLKDADKMFTGLTASITANFNAMSIGISVVEKMSEATSALIISTDSAFVSFQKQTGAVSLYGAQISALEAGNYNFGISIDEAADSQASLVTGIKNFNTFAPDAQNQLLRTTAILNEMGVDSGITAQSLNFMTNSLGMTANQADQTTREMFVLAKSMGMPPQEMAESFTSATPQLAAFGSRANTVFQKMAVNARSANMEVSDMLRITEQFDKFDTAASAVGKLNAALGGPYLSTIKMVTITDPTERMRMMSEAARGAGKSFDSMDYYERKMIASAMGLKDVNELALVMANRFDLVAPTVEKTSAEIEELAQQTQSYNTIMEEFSQLMRSFAVNIVGPVISGLKGMANGLTYLAQGPMVWVVAGIGLMIAAVGSLYLALTIATGGTWAALTAVGTFLITAGAAAAMMFKGLLDVVKSSKPFMDKLTGSWEKITTAFEKFNPVGAKGSSILEQLTAGFNSFVKNNGPAIDMMLELITGSLVSILDKMSQFHGFLTDSGVYYGFGKAIGHIAGFILFVATATAKLMELWISLYHLIFIGNSPPFLLVLEMVSSGLALVGQAFMFPIKMVGILYGMLKDLAGLLAGKALSFLSGAISHVFGGSPETQVNNGGFNRKEDMESQSAAMAEAVAKALKDVLETTKISVDTAIQIKETTGGLASLFDFTKAGISDEQSGRAPRHAMNASRARIGKS